MLVVIEVAKRQTTLKQNERGKEGKRGKLN